MSEEHPLLDDLVKRFVLEIDRVYNIQATWVSIEFLGSERAISIFVGNIKQGCPGANGQVVPSDAPISELRHEMADRDPNAKRFSQCVVDILDVIEACGKPMTTSRIMTALAKAGKEWSLSAVASHLAEMVKEGCLDNPDGVHPRGYRLPE